MPELDVTWLLPDGSGGGRGPEGPVVVPGAVPGDRVAYREERRRGRTVHGVMESLVTPSSDRRDAPCPWSARCGGCDLDQLTPEGQLQAKAGIVRHALRLDTTPPIVPSPRATGYRARLKLRLQDGTVGYHARQSHDLVAVDMCAIGRPELAPALARVRAFVAANGHEGLSEVELRSDGTRVVFAFTSDASVPRELRDALPDLGDVALDGKRLGGDPSLDLTVAGLALRASPRAFYQVNLEINATLVERVVQAVQAVAPERVLDLYAGNGNFSLPLAAATGAPVLAVEMEGQAIEDLRFSAERAGLDVQTLVMAVERFDPSREPFDVVVLDPPRAGAPGVVPRLIQSRPRRIVYVACHPASVARDLQPALKAGYTLTEVTALDLFPDTHHVETLVVLDRGRRSAPAGRQGRSNKGGRGRGRRR